MAEYPDLKGKVVLITGGAQGIGAAMVRAFFGQRAQVFFCDIDGKRGKALARELGVGSMFARVDLRDERAIVEWVDGIAAAQGQLHVLVNNAAADPRIVFEEMTTKQWDDLFALNLRAYFLAARSCSQWMKGGASIINFSSITFHLGPGQMAAYVATKGGILGFSRSLARELGRRRIRVNSLSPGWIMTERQLRQFVSARVKREIRRSQCIPELIQPEEIASVALFLASESSAAITGQEILADRGWAHS